MMQTDETKAEYKIATHWDGCWQVHHECALKHIQELQNQLQVVNGSYMELLKEAQIYRSALGRTRAAIDEALSKGRPSVIDPERKNNERCAHEIIVRDAYGTHCGDCGMANPPEK